MNEEKRWDMDISESSSSIVMDPEASKLVMQILVRWAIRRVQNDGKTDKRPSGKVVTGEPTKGYSHSKRNN